MKLSLLFSLILLTSQAFSEEYETVVEDVVFNSSSKVILDEKTIRETNAPDLNTLITTQANITLFNNNFQPPQLLIRGGDSSHVLFVIDGVPVFDPSWAQRTINLNSLDIKNVKRIEILKGGQTVLYGGQALAAVIKIETFGSEFEKRASAYITGGLPVDSFDRGFDDRRIGASYETTNESHQGFKASGRLMQRKNQSPVKDSDTLYDQRNHNVDLAFQSRGSITTQLRSFYFKDKSWNPTTVMVMGQQSVADSDVQHQDEQVGLSGSFQFNEVLLKPRLALYGQKGWRFFFSDPSSQNVDAKLRAGLTGALLDLTLLNSDQFRLASGASYQKEDFFIDSPAGSLSVNPREADVFQETRAVYAHARWTPASYLILESGVRLEKVSHLPEHNNYQIGITVFDNTKIEWMTGYRAPSTSQKYGLFENPELDPETSQTYSLTQEFQIPDRGEISLTAFETSFDDYIEARSIGFGVLEYQNTAKVKTRGIETAASYKVNAEDVLQLTYAYQEPRDQERHEILRRRPRVSGSVRYFHTDEKWNWMLEGKGVGNRYDFFGNNRYVYPGYFLISSNVRYNLDELTNVSLRLNNWLDFRPEISIDYYGEGRSALLTLERVF